MSIKSNEKRIKTIISEQTGITVDEITVDTTFEQLNLNSFDAIDLIMTVEDEFDLIIDDSNEIHSVGDLVRIIG